MTDVRFFDIDHVPVTGLTYAVVAARYNGQWIYVRHHQRSSWEIPGGHLEPGETSLQAAKRELYEETGALLFDLSCIATYSVTRSGITGWGRLYFAEVTEIGEVPDKSEIAEIIMSGGFPGPNTYPDIQPLLYERVIGWLKDHQ